MFLRKFVKLKDIKKQTRIDGRNWQYFKYTYMWHKLVQSAVSLINYVSRHKKLFLNNEFTIQRMVLRLDQ